MRPGPLAGLLASLALLIATTFPAWGGGSPQDLEIVGVLLAYLGLAAAAGLAFWRPARAAGWHTAAAILGTAGFAVAMLMQPLEVDDPISYALGVVILASALAVGFAVVDRDAAA